MEENFKVLRERNYLICYFILHSIFWIFGYKEKDKILSFCAFAFSQICIIMILLILVWEDTYLNFFFNIYLVLSTWFALKSIINK